MPLDITTNFDNALSSVSLTPLQHNVIIGRYVPLIKHIRTRTTRVSLMFHTSRIIITVGSLIVPALLSIQGMSPTNIAIYWSTWMVSLLVSICNAMIALFKYDKKYYYLHTIQEKLISEGWQYIELTGRYSGFHTPGKMATHENQFVYFCHSIEKIRMKQVEEEYYKLSDNQTQHQGTQSNSQETKSQLIPPTPQQGELVSIPIEVVSAVKEELSRTAIVGSPSISQAIIGGDGEDEEDKEGKKNRRPESVSVSFDM
jgi:hypothetical protein